MAGSLSPSPLTRTMTLTSQPKQRMQVGHAATQAEVEEALRHECLAAAPSADLSGPVAAAVLAHVTAVGESLITSKAHSTR